jgi:protein-S-isoprenylcysteine O-methyltransferase Ste14/pimeloyl-ACP methyl ester carboxylesterase
VRRVLTRSLLAFLALPGIIAVMVPLLLVRFVAGTRPFRWVALVPLLAGAALLLACVREFHVTGKGTLAPWDPPRHLVRSGLYRYTRNPMYLAVSVVLLGWAVAFSSLTLLVYALAAMAVFHLYVVFVEEPWLARTHREEWRRYAAAVPRWVFRSNKQVAVAWMAAIVLAALAGLIYEAVADDIASGEIQPPGVMVDIGGRRLHLLCLGEGEPTVLFEASGWGTALSAARVRERIAAVTRVCSYDRSGNGWSEPGPAEASAGDLARDLAVLQDRARLRSPFVLVASSIGGLTAEMFARSFPERTAGLVFVDAANSRLLALLGSLEGRAKAALCVASVAAHFGVLRLINPFALGDSPDDRASAALVYNSRPWRQLCAIARAVRRTTTEFAAVPTLRGDLPIVALSAGSYAPPLFGSLVDAGAINAALQRSHQEIAQQSSRGSWKAVPGGDHLIAESHPDVVADTVLEMLQELR